MKLIKQKDYEWADEKYVVHHKGRYISICWHKRLGKWYFVIYYPGESYNSVADELYFDNPKAAGICAVERIDNVEISLF